jgi:DNA topoisomerase I
MRLVYVNDSDPGFVRRKRGQGFAYYDEHGRTVKDRGQLARIKSLVIPPAWTSVWICTKSNGHIQATGRDARKRKQYRYHAAWSATRNEAKFNRMIAFGEALPSLRRSIRTQLNRPGIPRRKVIATVLKLLDQTLIRIGNDEYAKTNLSFGLTTMRDHHARIKGERIQFRFKGKSGVQHDVAVQHKKLARIVRQCQELPGQRLFAYRSGSQIKTISSSDVNRYLREVMGSDFTAKDFRTWHGSVLAASYLSELEPNDSITARRREAVLAIKEVAECLRNRPATCKKYYVHPIILTLHENGKFSSSWPGKIIKTPELSTNERRLLALLRRERRSLSLRASISPMRRAA